MKKLNHKALSSIFAYTAALGSLYANPADLEFTKFSDSDLTPSPACLCADANGDIYVGVDMLGSLGKGPGKGRIVKLIDTDNDGKADKHTIFATVDNPRGLISMGDKLYALHTEYQGQQEMVGMYLSVFEDKDHDGVADAPAKHLIKDISNVKFNRSRGADHTTNGIRMGIDGWIYIAVGDFGFVNAEGTDGTKMTQLGGGILRVRPDGTEMELYTYGLRNIYDVAIDPFMNIFTRGNTNDGVGWWIRFIDQIQTGDYGYPSLYLYFTDEIIPALCDLGSGSGTGALFLDDPQWPAQYNKQPLMADWGTNFIYLHRLQKDGPTFTQNVEDFIGTSQPTDLDIDGSGRLYIAAWSGAGYMGSPSRGHIERVVPKEWKFKPFPNLSKLSDAALIKGLRSKSGKVRLRTQQEILKRNARAKFSTQEILALTKDSSLTLESRVAALFTFAQLAGADGIQELLALTTDKDLQEFALRALTDRKAIAKQVPLAPFLDALKSTNPRVQVAALVGLGRIGDPSVANEVVKLAVTEPKTFTASATAKKPLFESQPLTLNDTAEVKVQLDPQDDTLTLIADKGDDNGGDHIAWINPSITANGTTLELKTWKEAEQEWGNTALNKSCTGAPLKRKDGQAFQFGIGSHANSRITFDIPEAYRNGTFTATIAFADTANEFAKAQFVVTQQSSNSERKIGPHATPNSKIVVPHIAVQTLRALNGVDAALAAIDTEAQNGAIWALRRMHDSKGVDGLITKLESTKDNALKLKLMDALARLYSQEAPYDGSWWWNTKPDPHGPYFKPITWSASEKIAKAYLAEVAKATPQQRSLYASIAENNKAFIPGINDQIVDDGPTEEKVGDVSIENVMLAFESHTANLENGKKLLKVQSCIGCHSIEPEHTPKGPDLNHIGSILDRAAIAEAIIKPDATIAENWVNVTLKDGSVQNGTLVSKDDAQVVIRNIAGLETTLRATDVASVAKADSTIMGPHQLDALTLQEFVDVVEYLASKK